MKKTALEIGFTDALPWRIGSIFANISQINETAETARGRLLASPYLEVRKLHCDHHEGVLVLRGQVPSYYYKQMAQEAVRNIQGVEMILNAVDVALPRGA
jgi:osmotically-inducible protein OsmY